MHERDLEAVHARLLDLSWPYVVRHLEDIQMLSLTQPRLARAILQMTASARAASAARHVVIADAQDLAKEVQYWEDRHRRFLVALGTDGRRKPAKVWTSSPRFALVPKPEAR